MEAARAILEKSGAVVELRKRGRSQLWAIRYRTKVNGHKVQRAIYVGDASIATRARQLIEQWRDEAISTERRTKKLLLSYAKVQGDAAGLSKRAQRRLCDYMEGAMDNRLAFVAFALGVMPIDDPLIRYGKRRGRPPKAGLW